MSGVVATLLDVGALIFLVEVAGVHVTLAAFLAATLGAVTNFLVNKYWAFEDESPFELRQCTLYGLVSLVTAAFVAVSVHILAVMIGLPYLLAKAVAAVLVFLVWSYPAQVKIVFPDADPSDSLTERLAID
jgi:putative flippase GtrA